MSTHLHTLIHSLTAAEKGYFKKYAGGKESSSAYLKLFDAINEQSEYDEEKLKKRFEKRGTKASNFTVLKSYLYQMVLDAMRTYHAGKSSTRQLHTLLDHADFLREKALYEQASSLVASVFLLAEKEEKHEYALLANIRLLQLLYTTVNLEDGQRYRQQYEERAQQQLQHAIRFQQVSHMQFRIFLLISNMQGSLTEEERAHIQQQLGEEVAAFQPRHDSTIVQLTYYNVAGHYYRLTRQRHKAVQAKEAIVKILRPMPANTIEVIQQKIIALNDLLTSYHDFYQYEQAAQIENEMQQLLDENTLLQKTPSLLLALQQRLYTAQLLQHCRWAQFAQAHQLWKNIQPWFQQHEAQLSITTCNEVRMGGLLSGFATGQHRAALLCIQQLLYSGPRQQHRRFKVAAMVTQLIIHFESKDWLSLTACLKPALKLFHEQNHLNREMQVAIAFLKAKARNGSTTINTAEWKQLRDDMSAAADPEGLPPFGMFNIYAWLESKINRTAYDEELRKSAQAKQQSFAEDMAAEATSLR